MADIIAIFITVLSRWINCKANQYKHSSVKRPDKFLLLHHLASRFWITFVPHCSEWRYLESAAHDRKRGGIGVTVSDLRQSFLGADYQSVSHNFHSYWPTTLGIITSVIPASPSETRNLLSTHYVPT